MGGSGLSSNIDFILEQLPSGITVDSRSPTGGWGLSGIPSVDRVREAMLREYPPFGL